jgi:CheY-like chemotaxis protein
MSRPNVMEATEMIDILLVEDNPGDVGLARQAIAVGEVAARLHVAKDGGEALDFLYRRGAFALAPRPDLILLDLNMPGIDGRDFLASLRSAPTMSAIPVVVLTGSLADVDIATSYRLNANDYIRKPLNFDQYVELMQKMHDYCHIM